MESDAVRADPYFGVESWSPKAGLVAEYRVPGSAFSDVTRRDGLAGSRNYGAITGSGPARLNPDHPAPGSPRRPERALGGHR